MRGRPRGQDPHGQPGAGAGARVRGAADPRRLHRLRLVGSELPAVGIELFSPVHGSSVGEVVLAAQAGDTIELLAVLQEDAVNDGRIHLGSSEGPTLTLLDLPYQLDADKEIQR